MLNAHHINTIITISIISCSPGLPRRFLFRHLLFMFVSFFFFFFF
jgi:hypothetical protein